MTRFTLAATQDFTFKGRRYAAGEVFALPLGDAYKVITRRQARRTKAPAVVPPEVPEAAVVVTTEPPVFTPAPEPEVLSPEPDPEPDPAPEPEPAETDEIEQIFDVVTAEISLDPAPPSEPDAPRLRRRKKPITGAPSA